MLNGQIPFVKTELWKWTMAKVHDNGNALRARVLCV